MKQLTLDLTLRPTRWLLSRAWSRGLVWMWPSACHCFKLDFGFAGLHSESLVIDRAMAVASETW